MLMFEKCIAGWYIFAAQVLAAVDFPLSLPVVCILHIPLLHLDLIIAGRVI